MVKIDYDPKSHTAANEEVWALAELLEKAIPNDARAGLVINALSCMISTRTIGQAASPEAARAGIRLIAKFMVENTNAMIDAEHLI